MAPIVFMKLKSIASFMGVNFAATFSNPISLKVRLDPENYRDKLNNLL
jgi:hypothetical protein